MKAKTIPELRKEKGISMKTIEKAVNKQTYYNWISGKADPFYKSAKKECVIKFCKLFEIDEKTFKKLLKSTLKSNIKIRG